jgi:hypothetical protein
MTQMISDVAMLRAAMTGTVLEPGDEGYDEARSMATSEIIWVISLSPFTPDTHRRAREVRLLPLRRHLVTVRRTSARKGGTAPTRQSSCAPDEIPGSAASDARAVSALDVISAHGPNTP